MNNPFQYTLEEYIIATALKGETEHKFKSSINDFGVITIEVYNDTTDIRPEYIVCDNYLETLTMTIEEINNG